MNDFSWKNDDLVMVCGQCHFKDEDPSLCHSVEPPIKKKFVPRDVSSCSFVRESQWERMPPEQQRAIQAFIAERSKRYYSKHPK